LGGESLIILLMTKNFKFKYYTYMRIETICPTENSDQDSAVILPVLSNQRKCRGNRS
jgi:hypothetical protein